MLGKTVHHFRILGRLGAGGMGEVYRARDERLGREVAVKALPEEMAADAERLRRLEAEARAMAAVDHPNVATIHSVEEHEGRVLLVLELVEGESLAERLERGPLSLEEALELARQVAAGLEAAHAQGIVHRDLKPGNVMLTPKGQVKILDFGLAKALESPGVADQDLTRSPTLTMEAATQRGMILGTAPYLSPEQARGQVVDERTDVWAFGCLTYEMLTARRAFGGGTVTDTIAAVVNREPDWEALPTETPAIVRWLLRRCLDKDPDERLHAIGDVRLALEDLSRGRIGEGEESSARPLAPSNGLWHRAAWGIAAVAVAAAILLAAQTLRETGAPQQHAGLESTTFTPLTSMPGMEWPGSWSPDGSFLAYQGTAHGSMDVFVMPTAGGEPFPLVRSPHDESLPRWSPDSKWIAYVGYQGDSWGIQLVSPLGGPAQRLVATPDPRLLGWIPDATLGTSPWSPDGDGLIFARSTEGGSSALWRIELETRSETQLTHPEPGVRDGAASWSPDGRQIVFNRTRLDGTPGLWLVDLDGGEPQILLDDDGSHFHPDWTPDGKAVVYTSVGSGNSDVWALETGSGRSRRLTVSPTSLRRPVMAPDGSLAIGTYSHQTDLYLHPTDGGAPRRLTHHTHDNFAAALSPQGDRIAYQSNRTGNREIWMLDLDSGRERRLTDNDHVDSRPTWTSDGRSLVFLSDRAGKVHPWSVEIESGRQQALAEGSEALAGSDVEWAEWAPDASRLGLRVRAETHGRRWLAGAAAPSALWLIGSDGEVTGPLLEGLREVRWYRDGRQVLYLRDGGSPGERELRAADLASGADELLHTGWIQELAVSADGTLVTFVDTRSHFAMNLYALELEPAQGPSGLPRVVAGPRQVTDGQGAWHVHNGSVSSDGSRLVYTRDTDSGDIYLLRGAFGSPSTGADSEDL